ncbi:cation:proton antiporter [Streptomyces sp. ISL-22]|uniref:cation:proton antiporter n=1 Tax=unclassified Streptomyces TaxID=2593676 RepID=UPI001BE8152E|nr:MULTISPECIES: cation:proton antiporter [unclassified Streptomyces]MBT2418106.1 cation:proton antiporter [Streptomyces sp. ISL-24]MBT2432219.1 cation:proton antiporter [Streptomyces sp. ISL-22]
MAEVKSRGTTRVLAVCLLSVLPLLAAALLLWHGTTGKDDAKRPESGSATPGGAPHVEAWQLLLALAVVVAVARACGALVSRHLAQPRVVGEMISGIVLGPSVLGLVAPGVYDALFPAALHSYLNLVAQIGLALFMFLIGMEFGDTHHEGAGRTGAAVGIVGVCVSFALGCALGYALYTGYAPDGVGFLPFTLFLGIAMSVTAFPVLARLLMERGMLQSRAGTYAIVGAATADLACWLLLAGLVALLRGGSPLGVLRTLALTAVFFGVMVVLVRPALRRVLERPERRLPDGGVLTLIIPGVLLSAVATELIGIHLIFGAFLFGAICPKTAPALVDARGKLQELVTAVLLPPFFASVGLKTDLLQLGQGGGALWVWAGVALLVAVVGKLAGSAAAAALMSVERVDALRIGVLMNCRGLTELVILTIGLELGVLTPALFTMLVIVTLCATVMTAPLLDLLDRAEARTAPARTKASSVAR